MVKVGDRFAFAKDASDVCAVDQVDHDYAWVCVVDQVDGYAAWVAWDDGNFSIWPRDWMKNALASGEIVQVLKPSGKPRISGTICEEPE